MSICRFEYSNHIDHQVSLYYLQHTTVPTTYYLQHTTYYLQHTTYNILPTYYLSYYLLPTTYYLLPTTYYLLPTTYYSTYYQLPTTYYLLPTTYYLLPTTYYLLPTTYYLLPTTYYLLPRRRWCRWFFERLGSGSLVPAPCRTLSRRLPLGLSVGCLLASFGAGGPQFSRFSSPRG